MFGGYKVFFSFCHEVPSQQVDPSGPLATLRGLLLSDESLANLQRWIVQHWYAVLFVVLAVMVLLVSLSSPSFTCHFFFTSYRSPLMSILLFLHRSSSAMI